MTGEVVDIMLHRSNAAAHELARAVIEFRDAEKELRGQRAQRALGDDLHRYLHKTPEMVRVLNRHAKANAGLQNAIKEYERAALPMKADHGG